MSTSPPGTGDRPDVTPPGSAKDVPGARTGDRGDGGFAGTLRRSLADRQGDISPAGTASADVSGERTAPVDVSGERTAPAAGPGLGTMRPGASQSGAPTAEQPRVSTERAGAAAPPRPAPAAGPRRVRLSLSRIDPWSAMKLAFLLSVGVGIMIVVAAAVVWFVLDAMHVFADIEALLTSIGSANFLQLMDYLEFDRVMSFATIVGVVDILLLTALGTIGAFLYNIVASLVGGLHVTLTDD